MKQFLLLPLALLVACGDGQSTGPTPDPVSVATTSLPDATVGGSYNVVLAASGGTGSYGWSMAGGSLPAGLSLSAGGAITGTPTTPGTSSFTARATSGSQSGTRELTVTVLAPDVQITTATLPNGSVGTPYSQSLQATGGTGSYGWTIASGTLPAGLTLSQAGVISGTPSAGGESSFTVQAASGGRTATRALTVSIAFANVAVTTTSLADGTAGTAYSQTLSASGGSGSYTWALASGTLPLGLSLYASGAINGTPTAGGTSNFMVLVLSGAQTATRALSITVQQPMVTITTTALPEGTVAVAYNQTLSATGGTAPITWSLTGGSLPPGLTLSANGNISGTPTTAGSSTFSVRATSGALSATASLTIVVQPPLLTITTTALKAGGQDLPYADTLRASGGTGSYSWAITAGSLPAGLTLSPQGIISGTPTAQGTSTFTIRATSGTRTATRDFTITIGAGLPDVAITTTSLPDGVVSGGYSQQLQATGGTGSYSWSITAGSLPPGLTLSAAGLINGAPISVGTWTFTVRASSGNKSAERQLSITVAAGAVSIDTGTLQGGLVGVGYNQNLSASGGAGPGTFTWTVTGGSLPGGLNLSAAGAITGSPTATGTFNFTVQASSGGFSSTRALTIVVEQPVSITTASVAGGTAGTAYSQTLSATGGTGSINWSVASGSLPGGVTLSSGGVLSGTPASAGNYTFTVRATSSTMSTNTATRQFTLTVQPAATTGIVLNVGDSPTATVNVNGTLSMGIAVDMSGRAPTENLASLTVFVSWDPAKFDYVSSSQGSWQDDTGGGAFIVVNADNAASGSVGYTGFTAGPTTHSFSIGGLTLRAKAAGATTVSAAVTVASSQPPGPVTVTPRNLSVTIQ